jgi:hypothetical protein
VPSGDVDAVTAALDRFLGDEALRTRLGEAAAETASTFDLGPAATRTEAIYDRLMAACP